MIRLAITILLSTLVTSIYLQRVIPMRQLRNQHGWMRLHSMMISEGKVELKGSLQFQTNKPEQSSYSIQLMLINEVDFAQQQQKHCLIKRNSSSTDILQFYLIKKNQFKQEKQIVLAEQAHSSRKLLVLRDCQSSLINQYFQPEAELRVKISLTVNNSHFTSDHYYQILFIPLQIFILYKVINILLKNKKQQLATDFNESLRYLSYFHLSSLLLNGILLFINVVYGRQNKLYFLICWEFNSAMQFFLGLMLLNLNLGWKITEKEEILASQLLYKIVFLAFWNVLNYFSHNYLEIERKFYQSFILISKSIILFSILVSAYFHCKSIDKHFVKFYNTLTLISIFFFLSGYAEKNISDCFAIELKVNIQMGLFYLKNTITLLLMVRLLARQGNIYQKVALSKKSFMD